MTPALVLGSLLAVTGAAMGSAVSALAWRVPRGVSWVRGRSACPSCATVLGARDLVPLLSFALARGRCRACGKPIGWRYPVTELACAAWLVLLVGHVGLAWAALPLALWGLLLVALLWIDLDFQLLPDVLTLPGLALGLVALVLLHGPTLEAARHGFSGLLAGAGVLWGLGWLWLRVRKIEAMGFGDVKLAAMFGVVLGWQLTLLTLFVAALLGSAWGVTLMMRREGGMKSLLPFGTLLAPAALIVFLWGDAWLSAYTGLLVGR
jgi:leader peptidase (prepilin peptidase) / N-methyltransferase